MARKAVGKVSPEGKSQRPAPAAPVRDGAGPWVLNVRPDGIDFRDQMYVPTLVEVPLQRDLEDYLTLGVPILDQGRDGACTGFGLAAVAHYLLRTRKVFPDPVPISPAMLYAMARRYDEWAGEDYEGSSCRGAMKGWYKHGVCGADQWRAGPDGAPVLSQAVVADAAQRPLGAYFRVNHKNLVALHAALAEVGVLYASARVHSGWTQVGADGRIPFQEGELGGHAVAIVAYDQDGLWIQNSWGSAWGRGGCGHLSYGDWLANGSDVWVARLGVPVNLPATARSTSQAGAGAVRSKGYVYNEVRPHLISLRNDGQLDGRGDIGTPAALVREILGNDFPRITQGWKKKRLVLYAHGGLVGQDTAIQRVAEYRRVMLDRECYPLAFIWKSDYWSTIQNILEDATRRRRPEGILDDAKDFMLDRLDDALEPIARAFTGKAAWDEMKENALGATTSAQGGARLVADEIALLARRFPELEIHLVGHSAGSIFHGPLVQYLVTQGPLRTGPWRGAPVQGLGLTIKTCTLWAPACTLQLFKDSYWPALRSGAIGAFTLFTLTGKAEQDDHCAQIYHKSLLYLVSNAFEDQPRIPVIRPLGVPVLGMAACVEADADLRKLFNGQGPGRAAWVLSPNSAPPGSPDGAASYHHGDFDDDDATVRATLARILDVDAIREEMGFRRTASSQGNRRRSLGAW